MAFYSVRETLTNQERRNRYNQLRDLGYSRSWAMAVRDWTHPHFQMMVDRANSKEQTMLPPGDQRT